MATHWNLPDRINTTEGRSRRVGIEIEMAGIDVGELAALTAETLGGTIDRVSSVEFNCAVPEHGEFRIEVDFGLLKDLAIASEQRIEAGDSGLMDFAMNLLGSASTVVVPCEIVTPPLSMTKMAEPMDMLVDRLRKAGAKGTGQSMLYAFGVHLNVEPPDLKVETVLAYLRAFVCLYDWIVVEGQIDASRRLSPYIRRYDKNYELLIADTEYAPDWPQLIDDYLVHNPTRDRALDMLPMFATIDEQRVREVVDDPLIKPRPAFHYRLANSSIDQEDWSIADPWNRWMRIEQMAADANTLSACSRAYIKNRERVLSGVDTRWSREVRQWLLD